jgi:hypothetical protein
VDREISSRTTTAPYGRRAVREPAARDIVMHESAPTVARTQTGEWAGTSSLVVVAVASGARASARDEEPDMPIDEDPSFEPTEPGTDYPIELTAPLGRPRHVELVEEIPTGHATAHALEVTTIDVETELDGSPALPALAFEAPRREGREARDEQMAIVDEVVRQQVAGMAVRVTRLASWDQVRLPELTLDRVHELIARARHRRTVLEDWGYDRFAARRGLTALLHGPSGTGKTLVAGLIARELGVELYRVDLDRLLSRPTSDTARQIDELFDAAEDGRFVLLLDDVGPWFAARPGPRSASERRDRAAIDHLLQRLDAFEGVAIVTSHLEDTLAPALRRRLSMRVRFGLPDEQLRVELWAAHVTPELPTAGALDFARLARIPLSGAAIRDCALRAAYLAAQDGVAMTQSHLERALALEVGELAVLAGAAGDSIADRAD